MDSSGTCATIAYAFCTLTIPLLLLLLLLQLDVWRKNNGRRPHSKVHEINHQDKYMVLELSASDIEKLESFYFKISPATSFIEERNIRLKNLQQQFSIQSDDAISIQAITSQAITI